MPEEVYDLIILGGGPAGTSAAIYAARSDLLTLVIDKGLTSGALGMSHKIHNYPGIADLMTGADLLQKMRRQAEGFGARFLTDKVMGVNPQASPREVITTTHTHYAKALILATGAMGRGAVIPGEARLTGKGVSYCAICDGAFFRDQTVAVLGGNDEALEQALLLTTFANLVYLLVPTPALRASPEIAEQVSSHGKIRLRLGTTVQEILGNSQVEGARLSGGQEILPVQGIFVYLQGNQPITDYLLGQVETLEDGCIRVGGEMQTNVPGVFAVGDLLCKRIKQAVIAAAEGAMAAIAAEKYIRGRAKIRLDWR